MVRECPHFGLAGRSTVTDSFRNTMRNSAASKGTEKRNSSFSFRLKKSRFEKTGGYLSPPSLAEGETVISTGPV